MDVTEFLLIYPQFATIAATQIEIALTSALILCPSKIWKEKQRLGICLYTAHVLTCSWQQQVIVATSAFNIASGGGISAVQSITADDLDLTVFGKQFKSLRATLAVTGFTF